MRFISQDFTPEENLESSDDLPWMQAQFSDIDQFDPSQLNLLLLQSGLCY